MVSWSQFDADMHQAKFAKGKPSVNKIEILSEKPPIISDNKTKGDYSVWPLVINIKGQVRGGKNNMGVSRSGHHYPNKKWAAWRDDAVMQVRKCLPSDFKTIAQECTVRIKYVAGDKRRRDFPAICDALWHVLEKAGVVKDDTLLWPESSTREYNKENPMVILTIKT